MSVDLYVNIDSALYSAGIGLEMALACSTSTSYQRFYVVTIDPRAYTTPQQFNEAVLAYAKDQFDLEFGPYVDGDLFLLGGLRRAQSETALTVTEANIGSVARFSGSFDITGTFVNGKPVYLQQAPGPYTGKGILADEAEMDQIVATGSVIDAGTIRCYWTCAPKGGPVKGNIKFFYAVSG